MNARPNVLAGSTNISRLSYLFEQHNNYEDQRDDRKLAVSSHLECFAIEHPGKNLVGKVFDSFEVIGPRGNHECLLYQPLGMSFTEFLKFLPLNRLSEHLTQRSV